MPTQQRYRYDPATRQLVLSNDFVPEEQAGSAGRSSSDLVSMGQQLKDMKLAADDPAKYAKIAWDYSQTLKLNAYNAVDGDKAAKEAAGAAVEKTVLQGLQNTFVRRGIRSPLTKEFLPAGAVTNFVQGKEGQVDFIGAPGGAESGARYEIFSDGETVGEEHSYGFETVGAFGTRPMSAETLGGTKAPKILTPEGLQALGEDTYFDSRNFSDAGIELPGLGKVYIRGSDTSWRESPLGSMLGVVAGIASAGLLAPAAGASMGAKILAGAEAGAISGGVTAGIRGDNILKGAFQGALTGAAGGISPYARFATSTAVGVSNGQSIGDALAASGIDFAASTIATSGVKGQWQQAGVAGGLSLAGRLATGEDPISALAQAGLLAGNVAAGSTGEKVSWRQANPFAREAWGLGPVPAAEAAKPAAAVAKPAEKAPAKEAAKPAPSMTLTDAMRDLAMDSTQPGRVRAYAATAAAQISALAPKPETPYLQTARPWVEIGVPVLGAALLYKQGEKSQESAERIAKNAEDTTIALADKADAKATVVRAEEKAARAADRQTQIDIVKESGENAIKLAQLQWNQTVKDREYADSLLRNPTKVGGSGVASRRASMARVWR